MAVAGTWEKFVDDATQTPYYYNAETDESSWDLPEGYVEPEDAPAAAATTGATEGAAPERVQKWRRYVDDSTGKTYYYDEINDQTQWDEPDGEIEDASDNDENSDADAEDRDSDEHKRVKDSDKANVSFGESRLEKTAVSSVSADSPGEETREAAAADGSSKHNWVKHVDKATGKPYYHDTISGVTQWDTPEQFTEASHASAISAEYLEYLHRSRAERLARVTQQALDPDGNLSRLNALLDKIDSNDAAAEADEDTSQLVKERARAEWQQHVDPHTQRYYYHNIVTGETKWQKPDGAVVSALADWVPPETPDPEAAAARKKTVSGVNYVATAKFNRVTGKYEKLGGDAYWQSMGIAADREGRQMTHFFDVNQLEKNRADAQRIKEQLKRKNVDWKKVAAEKKAKKQKQKNEWLYQD